MNPRAVSYSAHMGNNAEKGEIAESAGFSLAFKEFFSPLFAFFGLLRSFQPNHKGEKGCQCSFSRWG